MKTFEQGERVLFKRPTGSTEWAPGLYVYSPDPGWHVVQEAGVRHRVSSFRIKKQPHSHAGGPDEQCPECLVRGLVAPERRRRKPGAA